MKVDKINRQMELDLAKGIGIVLVVWAHASAPFTNFVESFHMPFFFFVSGMLYKNGNRGKWEYIERKAVALLCPFWWWNLLFYPLSFCLDYWGNWSVPIALKGIAEIIFTLNKVSFLGATWFLPALFWISSFIHIYLSSCEKYIWCDIGGLVLCMLLTTVGFEFTFPYKISRTLICLLFYYSGYIFQKRIRYRINDGLKYILMVVFLFFYYVITNENESNLGTNEYDNKILFVFGAYMAIYFLISLSEVIYRTVGQSYLAKHFIYLGENSLDIVIWQFLAFKATMLFQIFIWRLPLESILTFPVLDSTGFWWVIYIVTGIYGSLLVKKILEKSAFSDFMRKLHIIR